MLAGKNQHRNWPDFFEHGFPVPVTPIQSPSFAFKDGRGVSLPGTLGNLLATAPRFRSTLNALDEAIRRERPDVILNFLEPMVGVYNLLRRHATPVIAIGHQFMLNYPGYVKLPGQRLQQSLMRSYVRLVGARSIKLALSFYEAPDRPAEGHFVCPPILREEVFNRCPDPAGEAILVYIVNHGYAGDIINWHLANPEVVVDCFYDKPGAPAEERHDGTLTFHRLDAEKFLAKMAACRAVVATAGFESVSEAAYFGKPVLMVPLGNHVEQQLNALDAEDCGLGIRDSQFDINRLLQCAGPEPGRFKQWVDRGEARFMEVLEHVKAAAPAAGKIELPLDLAK